MLDLDSLSFLRDTPPTVIPGTGSTGAPKGLNIPSGAKSKVGVSLDQALGEACFAVAMHREAVIQPGKVAGTFDVHEAPKASFERQAFGPTSRMDANFWNTVVKNALKEGKTVWTTDYSYNDYDVATRR